MDAKVMEKIAEVESLVYEVPVAGAMIGLGKSGSYRAALRGDIPTVRIGRLRKVPKAAFHEKFGLPLSEAAKEPADAA